MFNSMKLSLDYYVDGLNSVKMCLWWLVIFYLDEVHAWNNLKFSLHYNLDEFQLLNSMKLSLDCIEFIFKDLLSIIVELGNMGSPFEYDLWIWTQTYVCYFYTLFVKPSWCGSRIWSWNMEIIIGKDDCCNQTFLFQTWWNL